jgi:hypothetical protein
MERGYVKNLEDKKGRPARLIPGDPLPDDIDILPTPERLQGCTVAGVSEGINTNFFSEDDDVSQRDEKKLGSYPPNNPATVQPPYENSDRVRLTI